MSSFVRFKEFGFWTRDEFLLDWLVSALREIGKLDSTQAWQIEIGREWDDAISAGFPGGINPRLDKILVSEEHALFVIVLSKKIRESTIDSKLKRLADLFIALIEGKLKTTSSSPIDYW